MYHKVKYAADLKELFLLKINNLRQFVLLELRSKVTPTPPLPPSFFVDVYSLELVSLLNRGGDARREASRLDICLEDVRPSSMIELA
jgi:hypothetical protein